MLYLQALQAHPPELPVVPHKVLVSKRLSQCLNPTLPSGVHQKALEVYTYIFGLIKVRIVWKRRKVPFADILRLKPARRLVARPASVPTRYRAHLNVRLAYRSTAVPFFGGDIHVST